MIDPKRLTEKDKGRRVMFMGYDVQYGAIVDFYADRVVVLFDNDTTPIDVTPGCLNWATGTYSDGGAE